jgi:hypothetical protein
MSTKVGQLIACLAKEKDKMEAIKNIQQFVWESEEFFTLNEQLQQILSEFAYDLDFYVPDQNMQKEVPSYYGEEKLNQGIADVVKKLDQLKAL